MFLSKIKAANISRAITTFLCLEKKRLIVVLELRFSIWIFLSIEIILFICYFYYITNNQTLSQTLNQ